MGIIGVTMDGKHDMIHHMRAYIDGSVQERHNSIAKALDLCCYQTNPSICPHDFVQIESWSKHCEII